MDSPSHISAQLIQGFFTRYPQEAAAELHHLPIEEIQRLLRQVSILDAVEVFMRLSPQMAVETLERMEDRFFAELFSKIDLMHGAALLARMEPGKVSDRLALLPHRIVKELK